MSHIVCTRGRGVAVATGSAVGLLPKTRAYYRYNGSLTTPPRSASVRWLVLKEPVSESRQQVEAFAKVM